MKSGIACDKCGSQENIVINSRREYIVNIGNVLRRRRKCLNCGNRWSTLEIKENDAIILFKE